MSFQVARNPRPTFVTALPVGADGQEIYFQADSSNGIIWHLRYRGTAAGGSATYPWEFVGGPALTARTNASVTATTSTNTAKTGGPSFTLPLVGQYRLTYGATIAPSAAGAYPAITPFYAAATMGGAANNEVVQGAAAFYASVAGETYETVTSSSTLEIYYRSDSGTATFIRRFLTAVPIRVG